MKKTFKGIVTSDKMTGTASVRVETIKTHPKYGKRIKSHKKFLADNAIGAKIGQTVIIESVKPISKNKSFKVLEVVAK